MVATCTCQQFAGAHPYPFLLSLSGLVAAPPPPRTVRREESYEVAAHQAERRRRITPIDRRPAVLPIRKSQPTFASMVTVGRAGNNDIVVPDALVSKFHAVFRVSDGNWGLADLGSANGTRVGVNALAPKGPPHRLRSGDEIRFGDQRFHFLDAASLWSALR